MWLSEQRSTAFFQVWLSTGTAAAQQQHPSVAPQDSQGKTAAMVPRGRGWRRLYHALKSPHGPQRSQSPGHKAGASKAENSMLPATAPVMVSSHQTAELPSCKQPFSTYWSHKLVGPVRVCRIPEDEGLMCVPETLIAGWLWKQPRMVSNNKL